MAAFSHEGIEFVEERARLASQALMDIDVSDQRSDQRPDHRYPLSSVVLGAWLAVTLTGRALADPRTVVELFTSQGCSSCPAADKLLGELAKDPSIIALSLPIDYWDYLGWKATLADARFSARQRAYSHMRGDREVYTPQVVVNGTVHVLG